MHQRQRLLPLRQREQHEQVAAAQFLHLTEAIKSRGGERDAALFDAREYGAFHRWRQSAAHRFDLG